MHRLLEIDRKKERQKLRFNLCYNYFVSFRLTSVVMITQLVYEKELVSYLHFKATKKYITF